jgi:RNA polymerase sigma-70 factor (ECF subfamily)
MAKNNSIQSIALDFIEKRDDETFRKVISRLRPGLMSHTYKFVHNFDLCSEIVEKTFIAVWEKIDQYKTEYNFSTWVYAIAKNECLGQLRLNKKFLSHNKLTEANSSILRSYNPVVNLDIEVYGPSGEEITYHLHDKVVDEFNSLKEPYRTVIIEREINQKSLQDIADNLNWNLSTVKTRLKKARTDVANIIKEKHSNLLELYYNEKNS